jgi:hypothetical protein
MLAVAVVDMTTMDVLVVEEEEGNSVDRSTTTTIYHC